MRKLFLLVLLLLCTSVSLTQAQQTISQAREAEWKSYALPQTNFVRQITPDKEFIFRVPADWKQEGTGLSFQGPHSAQFKVYAQKIPDGYPLREYFATLVRVIKDQPGAAETIVTRRTQLQDLEARELLVEIPNAEGEMIRSTSWVAVSGPLALTFNLQVPASHAAEVGPFLKAIVQSVIVLPLEHKTFEELRTATLKTTAPGPIHEVENLVSSLNGVGVDREAAIARLTSIFSTTPDLAVDLLVDDEDGESHYERACVLARLGRINEAMTALEKAIELYPDQADELADEKDLKALAKLPAFKKLLPQPEK